MKRNRRVRPLVQAPSAFIGFRFPPDAILLAERGIAVDHVMLFRWVQRFNPDLIDAARPCRHSVGDR